MASFIREDPASKFGSDKDYLRWLSFQPSCLDSAYGQYHEGVGRNVAAHVRRSRNSGVGFKPGYCAVPLTVLQHNYQHQHGEKAVIEEYTDMKVTADEAKQHFDWLAGHYLDMWVASKS